MSIAPSVKISEGTQALDLNYTNNTAMFVGDFEKGPIAEPIYISSQLEFKLKFGRAREYNLNDWYQVYNYLEYSSGIWVCRAAGLNTVKSNNNGNVANSAGEWGDLLTIAIFDYSDYENNIQFDFGSVRNYISLVDILDYNFVYLVFRNNKLMEKFSVNSDSTITSNYIEEYNFEKGIFKLQNGRADLGRGIDHKECYNLFTKENYEIDIIIGNEKHNELAMELAESRRDCIAYIATPKDFFNLLLINGDILTTEVGDIIYFGKNVTAYKFNNKTKNAIIDYIEDFKKSEFVFFTIGYKTIKDYFSDKNIFINIASDIAGLKALGSKNNHWDLGFNNKIRNSLGSKLDIPKKDQDNFYKLGANILSNDKILSQKLFITKPSSINKLHQRVLFNYLIRISEKLIRKYVFEENTYDIRRIIAFNIKKMLQEIKSADGITAGKVYVTKTDKEIVINIYIKIPYMIDFINIRVTNSGGTNFSDIIIRG